MSLKSSVTSTQSVITRTNPPALAATDSCTSRRLRPITESSPSEPGAATTRAALRAHKLPSNRFVETFRVTLRAFAQGDPGLLCADHILGDNPAMQAHGAARSFTWAAW